MFILFFIIVNIFSYKYCIADQFVTATMLSKQLKMITPPIETPTEHLKPEFFSKNNNLRRKVGSPFVAHGEFLLFEGYVTDLMDVPLSNVVIKLWQANSYGYYNYTIADKENIDKYDIDFESTGTAVTDSRGYFVFFTVMPGYYGNYAPHLNVIIDHEDFGRLETVVFFSNHPRNLSDIRYNRLSSNRRDLVTCKISKYENLGKRCFFVVKLNGLHPTKRN